MVALIRFLPLFLCLLWGGRIQAGIGPETTLLVVNADSPLSLTLANQWVKLRAIPQSHVVRLTGIPTLGTMAMKDFRDRILRPVFDHMERLGIEDEIDAIVYSGDFPYAVSLRKERKRYKAEGYRYVGKSASLTGLTYFSRQLLAGEIGYLAPIANHYFRRELGRRLPSSTPLSKEERLLLKTAVKLLEAGTVVEARDKLAKLVEGHPDNAGLRLRLAEAYAATGQDEDALEQLREIQRLGYNNSLVLRNNKRLKSLRSSPLFREITSDMEKPRSRYEPPRGFRGRYHWSRTSLAGKEDLDRYYLSAVLAYTGPRGNSLPEIHSYLERSRRSDGSHPNGTVYLMENGNVRTETRQPWFAETCALLDSIGHSCRILTRGKNGEDGILPRRRLDIIGLSAGTKAFNWKKSGSRLLEGAFADSLTSYAGDFYSRKQTKLTEFLRHGAAGSSGAVSEPYALAEKFPLPLIHYYYALGYALAESWYQSVASPYHLILVGDPLAKPFADTIDFELRSPATGESWRGTVTLSLDLHGDASRIDHFELWVDGIPAGSSRAGEVLRWDTTQVADGYHEIHLVAVEPPPREGRITRRHLVRISNHGLEVSLEAKPPAILYGEEIQLHGDAPPGSQVTIRGAGGQLAKAISHEGHWEAVLSSTLLGLGTATIQAVAATPEGKEIYSKPLDLLIREPPLTKEAAAIGPRQEGFRAELLIATPNGDPEHQRIQLKHLSGKLYKLLDKKAKVQAATVEGEFLIRNSGFHQLSISTKGEIEVFVDGKAFRMSAPRDHYGMIHLPLFLEKGWHRLELRPSGSGFPRLAVILAGMDPPAFLGGDRVRSRK